MTENASTFTFQHLGSKVFHSIDGKETQERFLKWSMKGRLIAQAFCFDQPFQSYQKNEFVSAFMKHPVVYGNLKVVSSSGKPVSLGQCAESVRSEHVPCSVLSMEFFDRFESEGIVRGDSGHISKCLDDWYEDITVSDELRKVLLMEDSDNYDLYSNTEREEFLFRLFSHVCLGGSVCQYEDVIGPYLETTKLIYKDLVSVQKDSNSGSLHIASVVFKVSAQDKDGETFYPSNKEHIQDFTYLIVDPLKRHVIVLHHVFGAALFDEKLKM